MGVRGMLEKFLWWVRVNYIGVAACDGPKPSGGRKTPPLSDPLYSAHLTPFADGVSKSPSEVIMLPISGNVHGASLKPSELI